MEGAVLNFVATLSEEEQTEVYSCPATCISLFRCLPPVTQQIVCRLTILPSTPVPFKLIASFLKNASDLKILLSPLLSLRMITVMDETVVMNETVKSSLKLGFGGKELARFQPASVEEKYRKTENELRIYSKDRWECLLQFLADSNKITAKGDQNISKDMKDILNCAGFVTDASTSKASTVAGSLQITSNGFHFLLQERRSQLWSFLIHYLKYVQRSTTMSIVNCIKYLFRLSFAKHSTCFKLDKETNQLGDFIQHLRELGLMYIRKRKDGWFVVTPMIHLLALGGHGHTYSAANTDAFLILETNYRLYAYTESSLQLSILSTFAEMLYRFSKVAVAVLTRDSVRKALQMGITAEQIISYLRAHCMKMENESGPLVPPSIADQLRLWEMERDRFKFDHSVLYSNFEGEADFNMVQNYANENGLTLWSQKETRLLVVSAQGHDSVKHFWKKNKR